MTLRKPSEALSEWSTLRYRGLRGSALVPGHPSHPVAGIGMGLRTVMRQRSNDVAHRSCVARLLGAYVTPPCPGGSFRCENYRPFPFSSRIAKKRLENAKWPGSFEASRQACRLTCLLVLFPISSPQTSNLDTASTLRSGPPALPPPAKHCLPRRGILKPREAVANISLGPQLPRLRPRPVLARRRNQ